jgi:hypothetical protein
LSHRWKIREFRLFRHIFLEIDTPAGISGLACTTTGQAKWQSDCGEQG